MNKQFAVVALCLVTLAFSIALVIPQVSSDGSISNLVPSLRGDIPWLPPEARSIYAYGLPRPQWIVPCILGVTIYVTGAICLLRRPEKVYPVRLILWAMCGTVLISLLLLALDARPLYLLFTRSASIVSGGYQHASTLVDDLGGVLRQWPGFVQRFRADTQNTGGIALDPPGLTTLYYATGKLLNALPLAPDLASLLRLEQCRSPQILAWNDGQVNSALLQVFMPLWVALGVAPLYRLSRLIFDSEAARWSVALWPLVPGLNLFTPRFNVLYPLLTMTMLLVLWRGLDRGRVRWLALAGFIVSAATFLNLSLIPLGLLAALTIMGHWLWRREHWRRLALNLLTFAFGCASVWWVYSTLSGVNVLDVLTLGLSQHLQLSRPYLPYLFIHPYEMFMFVGLPLAFLAIWQLSRLRAMRGRALIFSAAAWITLIVLVLSGTARGETGRVWLFFVPLWIILAADILRRLDGRSRIAILGVQAVCLLSIAAVLRVQYTGLVAPPALPPTRTAAAVPVNAQFAAGPDRVTLVGFSASATPDSIQLDLHWRADSWVKRLYVLSLVTVPPDKAPGKSMNWVPLNWEFPLSCWIPGQEFVDTVNVPIADHPVPGEWWFSIAVTDIATRQPMLVGGHTQTGIGPVNVP